MATEPRAQRGSVVTPDGVWRFERLNDRAIAVTFYPHKGVRAGWARSTSVAPAAATALAQRLAAKAV